MTEDKTPRKPVLKPKKKSSNSSKVGRSADSEPVLLPGKGYYQKSAPPYVLIAITFIGISIVCWKMWAYENKEVVLESPIHTRESVERLRAIK